MTLLGAVSFASALAAAVLATALVARDPGLRVSRLLAAVPASIAWWGLCQALWCLESDPDTVAQLVRMSGAAWILLGALCFHIFVEMSGESAAAERPFVPWLYAIAGGNAALYVFTPWGLVSVVERSWGWGHEFGPAFPFAYLSAVLPCAAILLRWSRVHPSAGSIGERRVSRFLYRGVLFGVQVASVTDVILPYFGHPVPQIAVPALTCAAIAVAFQLRRFGYSLLEPGAFAREILDTLGEGVALVRPDGRIGTANLALARLQGGTTAGLYDAPVERFLPDLPHRDWTVDVPHVETGLMRQDGAVIPVSLASSTLSSRSGHLLGSALVVRDLRELTELRQRLVTSGRLAAVGELSAGIAHEIRAPIEAVGKILSRLRSEWMRVGEVPQSEPPADPAGRAAVLRAEGEELIDECLEGVDRITAIVEDVGGLATGEQDASEVFDPNDVVRRAARIGAAEAHGEVEVETDLSNVPAVEGVARQLEQVVVNLVHNAVQASTAGRRVRATTRYRDGRVRIRVEDEGHGIDPAIRDRIFDPFFTTKPVGEGTGLGLAISYHIVQRHAGEIRVTSEPGGGSTFEVVLTPCEPVSPPAAATARVEPGSAKSGT